MKPLLYGPNNKPIRARNFDAAKGTRYTNDWVAGTGPADNAIKQDAKSLRDRARDSERNDGYIEGALMALESNVIGQHGIRMKSLARRADARSKKGVAILTLRGSSHALLSSVSPCGLPFAMVAF
jgi:capsid protein